LLAVDLATVKLQPLSYESDTLLLDHCIHPAPIITQCAQN